MNTPLPSYVVVMTTCPNHAEADRMASLLVDAGLAACVQMNPIESIYRWQGVVERSAEVRLLIKAKHAAFAEIEQTIRIASSYDNPEIIACAIVQGAQPYLDWILTETK
jgi:periplasmic divalent cation tolerance protein